MAKPRTIRDELNESSILTTSLHGIRTVFERELGVKNIIIASDEMIKQRLMQRSKGEGESDGSISYPYSYMVLNELQAVKEMQPNKVVRRLGYRMGTLDAGRATSSKGFIFPIHASIDLKYLDSDPLNVIKVAEAMMILGEVGALFFELVIGSEAEHSEETGDGMRLEVRLEIPESISIPIADTNLPSAPAGLEATLSFIMHGYAGFFRDVSAVNSARPTIDVQLQGTNYVENLTSR